MDFDALSQQAVQQGQQRQQDLDAQVRQKQQENQGYNQAAQAAQAAQADYSKNIPDLGAYAENKLNSQYKQLGVDPNAIANTAQRIAQQSAALVAAPQAAAQAGNYGGATAGQTQQGLDYTQSTLGNALSQSTGQLGALQVNLKQAADNANMITTAEQATVKDKIDSLNNVAVNASNLLQTSNQTMVSIQKQAQDQGFVTAEQVKDYQASKAAIITAQAAAQEASAKAAYLASQTTGQNITNAASQAQLNASQAQKGTIKFNPQSQAVSFFTNGGQQVSLGDWTKINNTYPIDVLQYAANQGDGYSKAALGFVGNDGKPDPNALGRTFNVNGRSVTGSTIYNTLFGNSYLGGAGSSSSSAVNKLQQTANIYSKAYGR